MGILNKIREISKKRQKAPLALSPSPEAFHQKSKVSEHAARAALKAERKLEAVERKKRLDIRALRKERKVRISRKIKRVGVKVRRERKEASYRAWKKRVYKKKENRIPKDTDFRSAQHLTSERRYSWMVKLKVYNFKSGEDETHFIGVSDNKRLSDREIKDKAVEILHTTETSPEYDLYSAEIVRKTVDRGYDEVK